VAKAYLRLSVVALTVLAGAFLAPPFARGSDEASKNFVLDNGLRVWLLEKRSSPLVNAVVAVNVGAKDEAADTSGLVHVLEHYILFRGTELRSGSQVSREVREHGAYFNAHTGEDLAWFEISVPSDSAEFALANQREIVFNLKIAQQELDAEKEVVLEELSQVADDPFRYATSLAYQNLFRGHPYENPIYGDKDVIRSLTVDRLQEFYQRYFVPANCSLAVVGDFNLKDMEGLVRTVFGDIQGGAFEKPKYEMFGDLEKGVDLQIEMDVQKSYLVIAVPAPDFSHPDQYAVELLTEILGRGLNPMLYSALSGRRRTAETLSMSYQAHRYGGIVLIFATLDPRDVAAAKSQATRFLKTVREANFSKDDFFGDQQLRAFDYLAGAKNQIRYRAFQAEEKGLALAASLAGYLLMTDGAAARPSYLDSIDKVKSGDLRKAAGKYLSRSDFVVITVTPKKQG
jgi:zinc protease